MVIVEVPVAPGASWLMLDGLALIVKPGPATALYVIEKSCPSPDAVPPRDTAATWTTPGPSLEVQPVPEPLMHWLTTSAPGSIVADVLTPVGFRTAGLVLTLMSNALKVGKPTTITLYVTVVPGAG